jgi:hypothetical protein
MSEQPSPTSPIDTTEKAEFGGINLLIGFVIGTALQFGWWALIDRLQAGVTGNIGFLTQLLVVLDRSSVVGFLLGAVWGATNNPANKPILSVIWKSTRWALGFGVAFVGVDVLRYALQIALGESLGDIITSAIWFGLTGAFAGVVMELQRTVVPRVGSTVLSFRQIVQWTLKLDGAAVRRVLVVALFSALIGITIELLFQRSSAWPFLLMLDVIVAVIAIRMWRPTRKTLRKWAIGALTLIVLVGLVLLLGLSTQLGILVGIVILVVVIVVQSKKDLKG